MNDDAVNFFYEHAGYGYHPERETPEEGRLRSARDLAEAEAWGEREGYSFHVEPDPDPMWDDDVERETTDYDQWVVDLIDSDGNLVSSLGAIDLGPEGDEDDPYIRVVKAELLLQLFNVVPAEPEVKVTRIDPDSLALDKIALMLGTSAEWSGADMLEAIANIIGDVRPHPGDAADTYLADFEADRGFDPRDIGELADYIDEDDDSIGTPW